MNEGREKGRKPVSCSNLSHSLAHTLASLLISLLQVATMVGGVADEEGGLDDRLIGAGIALRRRQESCRDAGRQEKRHWKLTL